MENAGCVTFLEEYVFRSKVTDAAYERRAETILHEMAHMWFGDLVTMRWWDDLWLNESFATYMSVLCQVEATRWTGALDHVRQPAGRPGPTGRTSCPRPTRSRPTSATSGRSRSTSTASPTPRAPACSSSWWPTSGRDDFLERRAQLLQAARVGQHPLADLLDALEETSGRDLTAWSKEWLETAGVNTLRPAYERRRRRDTSPRFAVLQEAPPEHPTLRPHRVAIGLYDRTDEGLVRRKRVELDVDGARTEVPELVGEARPTWCWSTTTT